eukprot:1182732-Amphidinium_carterae.1
MTDELMLKQESAQEHPSGSSQLNWNLLAPAVAPDSLRAISLLVRMGSFCHPSSFCSLSHRVSLNLFVSVNRPTCRASYWFTCMRATNLNPDEKTFSNLISACARVRKETLCLIISEICAT